MGKIGPKFSHLLTVSLTVKRPFFYDSPKMSQELRMLSNVPIVTIDWETRHDYHDLRFSIFIVSAFVSSVQELQCLSWSNTYPPHVLVDSGSYLSWFGCGSLSPTETWVKQIFLFLPMHCNCNLLFCWPSNSAPKIPYIIELSQIVKMSQYQMSVLSECVD